MAMLPSSDRNNRKAVLYGGTEQGQSVLYVSCVSTYNQTNKCTRFGIESCTELS